MSVVIEAETASVLLKPRVGLPGQASQLSRREGHFVYFEVFGKCYYCLMRQPTEFEMAVYDAVKQIPRGETRSYAWVAKQIGRPRTVRAVGSALNRNPYAPEVPCHRVIRSDGTIGGFANGTERKREMLKEEGVL